MRDTSTLLPSGGLQTPGRQGFARRGGRALPVGAAELSLRLSHKFAKASGYAKVP
jgi:hypothetical protein